MADGPFTKIAQQVNNLPVLTMNCSKECDDGLPYHGYGCPKDGVPFSQERIERAIEVAVEATLWAEDCQIAARVDREFIAARMAELLKERA
jgi:hypothetical protein